MEQVNEQLIETGIENKTGTVNKEKLQQYLERLKLHQSMPLAIAGAAVACLISALVWAAITVATQYQIGYMAIGVGLLVGYATRIMGKGIEPVFGIIGAFFSILGCLLGNLLSMIGIFAQEQALSLSQTISIINISMIPQIMADTFSPIDLLFYGIAVYQGYRFSFRQFTEEEVQANVINK